MLRRVLKFSAFMIFAIMNVFAGQTSRYPINPSGVWKVYISQDLFNSEDLSISQFEEYIKYYISDDTIINAHTYYKVYKTGTAYYDEPFSYENIYAGAIRDEDNKIYTIEKNGTVEKLLYDFDLNVDDTIKAIMGKGHIINVVDTLEDGRKTIGSIPMICAGCCPAPLLLEGIGNTGGLFETPPCNHPGFQYNKLVCYSEGDKLIYEDKSLSMDCESFTSFRPITGKGTNINVFPNPSYGKLFIELNEQIEFPLTIAVINACGSIVYSQKSEVKTSKFELNLETLPKGIYSLRISNRNSSLSKIIILN